MGGCLEGTLLWKQDYLVNTASTRYYDINDSSGQIRLAVVKIRVHGRGVVTVRAILDQVSTYLIKYLNFSKKGKKEERMSRQPVQAISGSEVSINCEKNSHPRDHSAFQSRSDRLHLSHGTCTIHHQEGHVRSVLIALKVTVNPTM